DLPQLQSLKLGGWAFRYVHSIVFENLPKLQSIQLGRSALDGDGGADRKTISDKPYNYKNTLTMRNLPSLTEFKGNIWSFGHIGSVILENIPRLSSNGIYIGGYSYYTYSLPYSSTHSPISSSFGWNCFKYTYSLQSSSMHSLISSSFDAAALESAIRSRNDYL
ncbi:hypothetical protein WA588_000019, partial [Blastocystis sp. NMH]